MTWISLHIKELSHYVVHIVTVATGAYYWYQHSILKEVIEGDLERRQTKEKPMATPLDAIQAELVKVQAIVAGLLDAIHVLAPKAEQAAVDAQQIQTDAKAAVAGVPVPPPAAQ